MIATAEAAGATNHLSRDGGADDDSIISARACPDTGRAIGPLVFVENCPGNEDGSVVVEDPGSSAGTNTTYASDRVDQAFYVVFD